MGTPSTPRRGPGRPRSIDRSTGLEPREEILRTAAGLFSAQGVGATRLADIAARVGVSAPAIYHHFDNLDAIVRELLDHVVGESAAYATRVSHSTGSSADRLHSLIAQHVERLVQSPYDLWFVAGLTDADRERFPEVTFVADRWRAAVARCLAEGRRNGEFRDVDRTVALAAVTGLVHGALELRHRGRAVDAAEIADLTVAAIRR